MSKHQPQRSRRSSKTCHTLKRRLRAGGLLLLPPVLRPCSGKMARIGGTVMSAMIGGLALVPNTFAESITLTIPADPLSLDITPTADGTFQESENANISVTTDALAGYKLTISSKDSSNDLTNTDGSGSKIQSIASQIAQAGAASSFTENSWGYLPSKFGGATNTDYRPGPNGTATILDTTNTKNNGAATDYSIKLGAKIDTTIPYGTYSNTFVLTATANQTPYSITYNKNAGSDSVSDMPSKTSSTTWDSSVSIATKKPARDGYEFVTWCTTAVSAETCSGGTAYAPGSTYNLTGATNDLTLYAVWKKKAGNSTENFKCTTLSSTGSTSTITDDRDGTTYKVAKLADGLCWITENLKIQNKEISSADSDLPDGKTFKIPASSTSGFSDDAASNVYVNSTYGGYYTWIAATAGTGSSVTSGGVNAEGSICPKGWRLPTKDEYDTLVTHYTTGSTLTTTPANFVYAGSYFNNSSLYDQGSYGNYWSSTAYSSAYAYYLYFYGSYANTNYATRNYGYSVRCVARE